MNRRPAFALGAAIFFLLACARAWPSPESSGIPPAVPVPSPENSPPAGLAPEGSIGAHADEAKEKLLKIAARMEELEATTPDEDLSIIIQAFHLYNTTALDKMGTVEAMRKLRATVLCLYVASGDDLLAAQLVKEFDINFTPRGGSTAGPVSSAKMGVLVQKDMGIMAQELVKFDAATPDAYVDKLIKFYHLDEPARMAQLKPVKALLTYTAISERLYAAGRYDSQALQALVDVRSAVAAEQKKTAQVVDKH